MIEIRNAQERGRTRIGWLDSRHTFSFANYYDPKHMGFRTLRVINDDKIAPDNGFGTHSHRDMEIITYVLNGALKHQDSLGNGSIIQAGEVQRMTAGTGIAHSEFNHSQTDSVHLLQIWLTPERQGLSPSYEQREIPLEEKRGQLRLIAAQDGRDGALTVHQDVDLYAAVLELGDRVYHTLKPHRSAWLQVAQGGLTLNGHALAEGDGAAINGVEKLDISTDTRTELLLFDLG